MFKFKSTIVTPTTVVFVGLLVAIMFMISAKPVTAVPTEPVTYGYDPEYTADEVFEIRNEVMRDYQLEMMPNGKVALYEGDRLIDVIPLDQHCNLTNAIFSDND